MIRKDSGGAAVKTGKAPFQHALSTPVLNASLKHVQALSELDPEATDISIVGISAFDSMSRRPCFLFRTELKEAEPSSFSAPLLVCSFILVEGGWRRSCAQNRARREGGEQGDVLMPLLFCVGQLVGVSAVQIPTEKLFAFLDDISKPNRDGPIYRTVEEALWKHPESV